MQAVLLSQACLASRALACLQNVRPLPSQSAGQLSSSFGPQSQASARALRSRRSIAVRSAQEDFAEVQDVKLEVPSVLKFATEPRGASGAASNASNTQEASDGSGELQQTGTVREVFEAATKAVVDAPVQSVGQVTLYGGLMGFGLLIAGAILNSVDNFPLIPEALQTVGVVYSLLITSQVVRRKPISFPPSSPFKTVVELVDSGQEIKAGNFILDVGDGLAAVMEKLANERDVAVNQAEDLRRAAEQIASVVAEKEALEAVSLQLADERDGAMSEVSALKDAIVAMTNRIKGIEEMLEREVSELKQQNQALETVSLQLAAERDSAIQEIEQLRCLTTVDSRMEEEKEALEVVAIQLAQERDTALTEIEELKKVVAILREATSTASGLTPEQEVFIKARVREIRSQYIDLERMYEDQKEEVDRFIEHLVQEYGAPHDWTTEYIKQFLNSSATKLSPPPLGTGISQVDRMTAQTSLTS